ncbi:MAG: penicillin-binding protein 2 [Orrella sp.]
MFDFKSATQKQRTLFTLRVWVAALAVLMAFSLLGARLWVLQVEEHEGLLKHADSNRTAVLPLPPRRGDILDRNGEVLARNFLRYTLDVTPAEIGQADPFLERLGKVITVSDYQKKRFKRKLAEAGRFTQVPLRNDLSDTEAAFFAAQAFRFPGVQLRARWVRQYPQGKVAAHVVGYVGRVSEADEQALEAKGTLGNYRGTDIIGKKGIEKSWEHVLHGTTGIESVEVTARGRPVRTLHRIDPAPGEDLVLSIDMRLQRIAEKAFRGQRGALVAIDPQTGEVLAFVSQPSFDPNLFVDGIDHESWRALNESEDFPLVNRPVYGTYPIGSTFKPFVALAALTTGKRDADTRIYDPGYFELGKTRFRNAGMASYGQVDLRKSLVVSSDTYYYSLASEITIDSLHDFMKPFGFGQKTGIDVDSERMGVLPSTDWKKKAFKQKEQQRWYPGETVSVLIGQGYSAFTIMQLAQATSVLANGGDYFKPHLVKAIQYPASGKQQIFKEPPLHSINLDPEHVRAVTEALEEVTVTGTARRAFADVAYPVAGKTGTAQLFNLKGSKYKKVDVDERLRDHSLFMGFAPSKRPTIALAILVENAGWGSEVAAPIAREVMDAWVLGEPPALEHYVVP